MSFVLEIIGFAVMVLGLVLILIGIFGIYRFKNFYARILVVSKIDTVGVVTFLLGLAIRHGFSFFSGKILLLVIVILILSPLVSHMIARSAYLSDHKMTDPNNPKGEKEAEAEAGGDGL